MSRLGSRMLHSMLVLAAVLSAGPLLAQDSDYLLRLSCGEGVPGDDVTLTLTYSGAGEPLQGYQWGICHDDALLDILPADIDRGAALASLDFLFEGIEVFPTGGWNIGVLFDVKTATVLEPGVELELYTATYALLAEGRALVEFCETLGDPLTTVRVIASAIEIEPVTVDGSIQIHDATAPFTYLAEDQTVAFDPEDGFATVAQQLRIVENPSHSGFPSDTQGFSMGLAHDPAVLTPSVPGAVGELADLNSGDGPSFFGPNLDPALGDGVTLGVIYQYFGGEFIEFDSAKEVVEIEYDVNSDLLIDNPFGLDTTLRWDDSLGNPPVRNHVVVDDLIVQGTRLSDACIRFRVPEGELFKRGDVDGNGSVIGLVDGIYLLAFGFSDGPSPPCFDAADVDDNGTAIALIDGIYLLTWAFSDGPSPPAPGPTVCGPDDSSDPLDCAVIAAACD